MLTLHVTRQLARKIEEAEGRNHSIFTQTLDLLNTEVQACCSRIGGGYAAYAGLDSPLTQAFGFGFQKSFDERVLDEFEAFYAERDVAATIEVCHLADLQLAQALVARGYQIAEVSNVLALDLRSGLSATTDDETVVSECRQEGAYRFARLVSKGFFEDDEMATQFHELFAVFCHQPNSACFTAALDGEWVGGGAVFFVDEIAILASASTLLKHRGRGVQKALISVRVKEAQDRHCDLAVVVTEPGTISQHNVEKLGFRVLYARTKFMKKHEPESS